MMRIQSRVSPFVWLAAACVAAPLAAAAQPGTSGVVVVAAAAGGGEVALGFIAGDMRVVTSVRHIGVSESFVVTDGSGMEYAASLARPPSSLYLAVLVVEGLSLQPLRFARDPVEVGQRVHGATLVEGDIDFVTGDVTEVRRSTSNINDSITHDAYSDARQIGGAPLLNECGQVVGVVRTSLDPTALGSRIRFPR